MAVPLTLTKLIISLNFATGGKDMTAFSGTLDIPAGFVFAGQKIAVDVGGVVRAFTLDAKGKQKSGGDSISVGVKPKNGISKYLVKMSKGTFSDRLVDEGLKNETVKGKSTTVKVNVIFNTKLYQKIQGQIYTAKQGKTGKSK